MGRVCDGMGEEAAGASTFHPYRFVRPAMPQNSRLKTSEAGGPLAAPGVDSASGAGQTPTRPTLLPLLAAKLMPVP